MQAKWERKFDCTDSQEVGSEAATLQRVRNSSLVEWSCADNPPGLKSATEAMVPFRKGRKVGERSLRREVVP